MITTSEGQYFCEPREDCVSVRIWAAAVDVEHIALHMSGHDERRDIETYVYLEPKDALNLAKELKKAVARQERFVVPRAVAVRAESN